MIEERDVDLLKRLRKFRERWLTVDREAQVDAIASVAYDAMAVYVEALAPGIRWWRWGAIAKTSPLVQDLRKCVAHLLEQEDNKPGSAVEMLIAPGTFQQEWASEMWQRGWRQGEGYRKHPDIVTFNKLSPQKQAIDAILSATLRGLIAERNAALKERDACREIFLARHGVTADEWLWLRSQGLVPTAWATEDVARLLGYDQAPQAPPNADELRASHTAPIAALE